MSTRSSREACRLGLRLGIDPTIVVLGDMDSSRSEARTAVCPSEWTDTEIDLQQSLDFAINS